MITWNYRVFRENENDHVIREVFYDKDGTIIGCTAEPITPSGASIDEIARTIDEMKTALTLPVLTFDDIPPPIEATQPRQRPRTIRHEDIRAALGLEPPTIRT